MYRCSCDKEVTVLMKWLCGAQGSTVLNPSTGRFSLLKIFQLEVFSMVDILIS